jgi:hypothetical protein
MTTSVASATKNVLDSATIHALWQEKDVATSAIQIMSSLYAYL